MIFTLNRTVTAVGTSAMLLLLTACGGGSSSGATSTVPPVQPPTTPPPSSQKGIEGGGIVTRFGASFNSVTVGDVTYDATSSALVVTVDGQPAAVSDLAIGNVVQVAATTDDNGVTALATRIDQINDLEGPIKAGSIDLNAGTFVVLEQTVRVVATTIFDDTISPGTLAGLADGDNLEVSVLDDGDGAFIATRIERDSDADEFEITGTVSDLDATAMTFRIGNLTVDFAAAVLEDFDNGAIVDGDLVEVEGRSFDAAGALVADSIERRSLVFGGVSGDLIELEGFVTRFSSTTDFDVNGFAVTTNAQTLYDDGTAADLALGVRVDVDGELDDAGVIIASKVDFEDREDNADIEIEALIDRVDVAASTITALGLTVSILPATALEDDSSLDLPTLGLADLAVGDFVEIKAYDDAGSLIAVQLKRDDADDNDVEIQGPVDAVMQPGLTVAGVSVATTPATDFEALFDMPITAETFFGQVAVGTLVKASGTWDGTTLTAREVEFED